jgi:SAM-dependent methyltransferase
MSRLSTAEKYAQPQVVEFWRTFSTQGLQACEAEMLARYAPPAPARVLDLGCGGGRAGLALMPRGYDVTGLDLSGQMLVAAQALFGEAQLDTNLVQADLRAIPASGASYDIALVFIAALQHIPTQRARRTVFAEIARVLRPGGVLILALDNLAPALTCYAWWGWRKISGASLTPNGTEAQTANSVQTQAADALLESGSGGVSALTWHARGLFKTLRWRTWTGTVDLVRAMGERDTEIGDTDIEQVSLTPTPGQVYYHLYRHAELVEDAAQAGLKLLGYHSGRELSEHQTFTPRVRQLDKQVLYAFRK